MVATVTDGADRPLWALPAPRTLIIRSPRVDETWVPERAHLTTTARAVPGGDARVEWALVANPTRATGPRGEDGRLIGRSKRQPLPEHEIPEWVCRKLLGSLLDIAVAGVDRLPALPGHNPKTGRTITHTRYAITGTGVVADHGALADLLHAGVGPGKAFGCGLLIITEVTP